MEAKLSEISVLARAALSLLEGEASPKTAEAATLLRRCRLGLAEAPAAELPSRPDALLPAETPARRPEPDDAFKTARATPPPPPKLCAGPRGVATEGRAGTPDAVRDLCADAGRSGAGAGAGKTKARRDEQRSRTCRSTTRTKRRSRRGGRSVSNNARRARARRRPRTRRRHKTRRTTSRF